MTTAEDMEKVNLNDIVNISDEEFKNQIAAWIDEHGVSQMLQSKLRADLFEQFNRTNLGRKMAAQHQQSHRIVLSPLILVLNTLVAEFLYGENCHFTLSVFSSEVPYKNTLPNFEETPRRQLFRFTDTELDDIFEAVGLAKQNEDNVREFYLNCVASGQSDGLNKSLLYCIFKLMISQADAGGLNQSKNKSTNTKQNLSSTPIASSSSQSSLILNSSKIRQKCSGCLSSRAKNEKFEVSSRYFKYLNRYLDILSERVREMSKSLADKQMEKKSKTDSSAQESSLKKDLHQIIEQLNQLTKSKQKNKRFQDILNSIERLSASLEKCSGNMENLLTANTSKPSPIEPVATKIVENTKQDRLSEMDYVTWLNELKISEHGRRFIDRLEVSLQKTMEKERENLEKLYEEKMTNYRMMIKLHYRQKYEIDRKAEGNTSVNQSVPVENNQSIDKEIEEKAEKLFAAASSNRAQENEQHVDHIVQSAKFRLQQLERESEQLDESFQAYLQRQQISKSQLKRDVSKIWKNYNLEKAALIQYNPSTDQTNLFRNQPKLIETQNIDTVLNNSIKDDVDVRELLKDLKDVRQLESPFKNISIDDIFQKRKPSNPRTESSLIQESTKSVQQKVSITPEITKSYANDKQSKIIDLVPSTSNIVSKSLKEATVKTFKLIENEPNQPKNDDAEKLSKDIKSKSPIKEKPKEIKFKDLPDNKIDKKNENITVLPKINHSSTNQIQETGKKVIGVQNNSNDNVSENKSDTFTITNGHEEIDIDNKNKGATSNTNGFNEEPRKIELKSVLQTNGLELPSSVETKSISNGIAKKSVEYLTRTSGFTSKISATDSEFDDSEPISTGAPRQSQSPDFWI